MPGYRQDMVEITDPVVIQTSGCKFHPIVVHTGDKSDEVTGSVFEISDDELIAADNYEVSNYKRVQIALKSGKSAWVYVQA